MEWSIGVDLTSDPRHAGPNRLLAYDLYGHDSANKFRYLRSTSRAQKRQKARAQKYFGFVAVKSRQLSASHHRSEASCLDVCWAYGGIPAKLTSTSVEVWSKCRMYVEAQQWPQP